MELVQRFSFSRPLNPQCRLVADTMGSYPAADLDVSPCESCVLSGRCV
jgi:hypothetical protein